MRKAASVGIGLSTVAVVAAVSAGVATASTATPGQSASTAAASVAVHHVTRARAAAIAKAKVPHSKVIEIESEEHHDRRVWQVQLSTPHGRVVVDVDKRTGKATIVRRGGGHGDSVGHGD